MGPTDGDLGPPDDDIATDWKWWAAELTGAADEIRRLRAEIERLETALIDAEVLAEVHATYADDLATILEHADASLTARVVRWWRGRKEPDIESFIINQTKGKS